jgi:hypothetical protein
MEAEVELKLRIRNQDAFRDADGNIIVPAQRKLVMEMDGTNTVFALEEFPEEATNTEIRRSFGLRLDALMHIVECRVIGDT